MSKDLKVIVLAAGKGSRMKSDLPKVLHPLGHRPMLEYVLDCAEDLNASETLLVINPDMQKFVSAFETRDNLRIVYQDKPLGTAHAVLAAEEHIQNFKGNLVIIFGDTPNIMAETLKPLIEKLNQHKKAAVAIMGMFPEESHGYARIELLEQDRVQSIIEQKDATEEQLAIDFCNSGVMALKGEHALEILKKIKADNAAKEFYLTDAVKVANSMDLEVYVVEGDEFELAGINSKSHLADAENILQNKWRRYFLDQGVTLIDPSSVYFSYDTEIAEDCVIEPHVVFGPGVKIGKGVTIRSFCYLSGACARENAVIGPFAHLRPGTELHKGTRIGNFVEIKNSILKEGAKANHLSYIGDSEIGARTNIGAGTITCNYDGFDKYRTIIGENVLIGSNSSLIAPVMIEDNAIVGAGSVITLDVPKDALAIARESQANIEQGATLFREKRQKDKKLA